jgi:ADP-ribose pyrophosphatase YjhB (NUDIX family)
LIKRTRPGEDPYWVTIGGGVEPEDATLEDALRREVLEEIGARIRHVAQILVLADRSDEGIAVQHVFLAELDPAQLVQRTGKEFDDPSRGGYELVRVPFTADGIAAVDLRPASLSEYLCSTHDVLLASIHFPVMNPATVHTDAGGEDAADPVPESERA